MPTDRRRSPMHYATQVRFTDAQRDVLHVIADANGVTISDVIRDAVERLGNAYAERNADGEVVGRTLLEAAERGQLDGLVGYEVDDEPWRDEE